MAYRRIFYRCVDWNLRYRIRILPVRVASFTDAWIETKDVVAMMKHFDVASFTDAWIETMSRQRICFCGKKSHLLQMRGLKLARAQEFFRNAVASFTDAWIETIFSSYNWVEVSRIFYRCVDWNAALSRVWRVRLCRIFYRCVDWNHDYQYFILYSIVASFTDAWIETFLLV